MDQLGPNLDSIPSLTLYKAGLQFQENAWDQYNIIFILLDQQNLLSIHKF